MAYTFTLRRHKVRVRPSPEGSLLDQIGWMLMTKTNLAKTPHVLDLACGWIGVK